MRGRGRHSQRSAAAGGTTICVHQTTLRVPNDTGRSRRSSCSCSSACLCCSRWQQPWMTSSRCCRGCCWLCGGCNMCVQCCRLLLLLCVLQLDGGRSLVGFCSCCEVSSCLLLAQQLLHLALWVAVRVCYVAQQLADACMDDLQLCKQTHTHTGTAAHVMHVFNMTTAVGCISIKACLLKSTNETDKVIGCIEPAQTASLSVSLPCAVLCKQTLTVT